MVRKSIVFIITFLLIFSHFLGMPPEKEINKFAQIPVLHQGRIKPIDTVARNSLLFLREKQSFKFEGHTYHPNTWLLTVLSEPDRADLFPVFRVDHPGLKDMLFLSEKEKTISFEALKPHLEKLLYLSQQFEAIKKDKQNAFQHDVVKLVQKINLYKKLKLSFFGYETASFNDIISSYRSLIPFADALLHAGHAHQPTPEEEQLVVFFRSFNAGFEHHLFRPIPLMHSSEWVSYGEGVLMELSPTLPQNPLITQFSLVLDGYKNSTETFNKACKSILEWHKENNTDHLFYTKLEIIFNLVNPFYKSMLLYGLSLGLLFISFFKYKQTTYSLSNQFAFSAFGLHTIGLILRMFIQGRPPVTNLYSSSVFVGWAAILLCFLLEKRYKNSVGLFILSFIGISTLIIAHHLSIGGDTLEMMQAVLDSNFWLATHVITVTIGYSATFVAGTIGIIYVCRGLFTQSLTMEKKNELKTMLLSSVYFALFFSFIGTVLGGIWADQSWGRFWGWDPKENGALLIVIWNAILIHARLMGFNSTRLMLMAIFGNIITSFSWFGVNLLGIGLHSYGFMKEGFFWLLLFILIQTAFIILGLIPEKHWAKPKI